MSYKIQTTATGGGSGMDEEKHTNHDNEEPEMKMKRQLVSELLKRQINLDDNQLGRVFGITADIIEDIRRQVRRQQTVDSSTVPLTWDYVLAFDVGSEDEKERVKPNKTQKKQRDVRKGTDDIRGGDDDDEAWSNGMTTRKYFGQIFADIWKRLEDTNAHLKVQAFRSADKKYMFLLVGITETDLKAWADERDTDLLLDPERACRVGRDIGFPLAKRTKLDANETDEKKYTLPLLNWKYMYAEYNANANVDIYTTYPRVTNDPNSPKTIFDDKTRLRLIFEAMVADNGEGGAELRFDDYILKKDHPLMALFPLHNQEILENFRRDWLQNRSLRSLMWCPLERIRNYFGEPVGFYYAFIQFYMKWLIYPSIVGLIFFIIQLCYETCDAPGIYIMCFFIIFWSVAFVDFWAREESILRLQWGMTKFQIKAVARPQFRGEWVHDTVTGKWDEYFNPFSRGIRASGVISGIMVFLGGCIAAVIAVLIVRDSDPNNYITKVGLGVANGAMISIFDNLYKFISRYGNDVENHRTQQDYENALILKSFFFKFFNSFASLFYLAFVRPYTAGDNYYIRYSEACSSSCTDEVICRYMIDNLGSSSSLCTNCTDSSCYTDVDSVPTDNFAYCITPLDLCTQSQVNDEINTLILDEVRIQLATLFGTALFIQNFFELFIPWLGGYIKGRVAAKEHAQSIANNNGGSDDQQKDGDHELNRSEAELQMEKNVYASTIDDMSELIIQFGYVTLFVLALPITPLCALINNMAEMRVDAYNLLNSTQRPHPNGSYGLGAWNSVLQFFSFIAVGTNVAIITWRTKLVQDISGDNSEYKWIFFSIVSVILALIISFEKWIIPDVPIIIEQAMARQEMLEGVLVKGQRIDSDREEPPNDDDNSYLDFNPSSEFIDIETLPDLPNSNQSLATFKP